MALDIVHGICQRTNTSSTDRIVPRKITHNDKEVDLRPILR